MAGSRQRRAVRTGEVVAVIGGAMLLVASWAVVAVANQVPHWEARLFGAVNDLPDFLWRMLWAPMQVGSFVGSLVVVALTAAVSRSPGSRSPRSSRARSRSGCRRWSRRRCREADPRRSS